MRPEDYSRLLLDLSVNPPDCVLAGIRTLDMLAAGRELAKQAIQLDDDEIKRRMLSSVCRNPPNSAPPD